MAKVEEDSYDKTSSHVIEYKLERTSYLYRLVFVDGNSRLELLTKNPVRTYGVAGS